MEWFTLLISFQDWPRSGGDQFFLVVPLDLLVWVGSSLLGCIFRDLCPIAFEISIGTILIDWSWDPYQFMSMRFVSTSYLVIPCRVSLQSLS